MTVFTIRATYKFFNNLTLSQITSHYLFIAKKFIKIIISILEINS